MTVSSAFTISRRTESFCFSSRRICIGTREWLPPLKSLRSARPHDRSRIEMSMKQRAGLPQIYTAWARCDEVCGIKWTLPIFRPTATSFSPTTASPGSRSSVNDSILHQAADDAEGELEVDAQGLADLGHERGWLAPQILHDGPSGFGLRPVSDDDYFGLPKVLDVGGEAGGERGGGGSETEVGSRVTARDGPGREGGVVVPRGGADLLRRGPGHLTRGRRGGAGRSRTGPRSFPRALRRVERGSLSTPRPRRQSRSCPRGIRTDSHRRSDRGPLSESRSFATG